MCCWHAVHLLACSLPQGGADCLSHPSSHSTTHPPALSDTRRRAVLDGVIRLSCRTDVQQDVRRVLGPVPPESHEAYSLAHELYGTTRMLLAVLDRQQLAEVCQVRGGCGCGSPSECSMHVLQLCLQASCTLSPPAHPAASLSISQPRRAGGATCGTCCPPCERCGPSTGGRGTTEIWCWTCARSTLSWASREAHGGPRHVPATAATALVYLHRRLPTLPLDPSLSSRNE